MNNAGCAWHEDGKPTESIANKYPQRVQRKLKIQHDVAPARTDSGCGRVCPHPQGRQPAVRMLDYTQPPLRRDILEFLKKALPTKKKPPATWQEV